MPRCRPRSSGALARAPQLAGLVNATLRRLQRGREALLSRALASDEGATHPDWLIARLKRDWPDGCRLRWAAQRQPLAAGELRTTSADYCPPRAGRHRRRAPELPDAVRLRGRSRRGYQDSPLAVTIRTRPRSSRRISRTASGMRVLVLPRRAARRRISSSARAGGSSSALDIDAASRARARQSRPPRPRRDRPQRRRAAAAIMVGRQAVRSSSWMRRAQVPASSAATQTSNGCDARRHRAVRAAATRCSTLWPLLRPGGRLSDLLDPGGERRGGPRVPRDARDAAGSCLGLHARVGCAQPGGGWQSLPGPPIPTVSTML